MSSRGTSAHTRANRQQRTLGERLLVTGAAGLKQAPCVISLNPHKPPMRTKSDEKMEAQTVPAACPGTGVRGRAKIQTTWPAPEYALRMLKRETERKHESNAVSKKENTVNWIW